MRVVSRWSRRVISINLGPGHTQCTVEEWAASSSSWARVAATTAAFDAE